MPDRVVGRQVVDPPGPIVTVLEWIASLSELQLALLSRLAATNEQMARQSNGGAGQIAPGAPAPLPMRP